MTVEYIITMLEDNEVVLLRCEEQPDDLPTYREAIYSGIITDRESATEIAEVCTLRAEDDYGGVLPWMAPLDDEDLWWYLRTGPLHPSTAP